MSRFQQEWAIVPTAARVIALAASLSIVMLMGFLLLVAPLVETGAPRPMLVALLVLASLIPSALMAVFILLVGYVWADAKRRGMNAVLWVLLAIFIPNAIGIILYFILREPLSTPCPSCQAPVGKGLACCASCGTTVRPTCPECRRPSESGWTHCGHCGALLRPAAGAATT